MYEPCWECKLRYGFGYRKECDDKCKYANEVKSLKDQIAALNDKLETAYRVVGQLVEKPNPFEEARDET